MATASGGWISVRTMRGRFEDPIVVDSLSAAESPSTHLLHDSLDDFGERLSLCGHDPFLTESRLGAKERSFSRHNFDDRHIRRRDSYELKLEGNEHRMPPRRLQSDEGPSITGEPVTQSLRPHMRKGGYNRRDKDPELLAWKSLQNVNVRPVKIFDSPQIRDQVSSISSDGSEDIESLGGKHGRDIYAKVSRIRESMSPVVLRKKSNYVVNLEDRSTRTRHERKFLDHSSSPVLDFRERKLAFEKAVGALDERFKSLTKSSQKTKSVARKMRSDESRSNFPVDAPKYSPSKTSSESASANSSFEAEDSFREGSSSYQRQAGMSKFRRLRPISSSTGSSKSSENSSPRVSKGKIRGVFDFDSEKEADSNESLESRLESPTTRSNETELNLSYNGKVNEIDETETGDEEIPVFCVQDFIRGRERTRKESPARSRSEGAELKARGRHGSDKNNFERRKDSNRKVARSSNDINLNDTDQRFNLAFRDKQRMLEDVMNAENVSNGGRSSRARSVSPRKGANVFRKISFTSKSDKDRQNNIARGRLTMNHPIPKKQHDQVDNSNETFGKKTFSKLIPKIPPFAPALRFPLASNEKTKQDVKESQIYNSENIQKKNSSIVLGRNFLGKNDVQFSSKLGEVKSEVNEVVHFEKKKCNEAGNRKSLPEIDMIQLKGIPSGSHRRNKSTSNDIIVASVVSSSDIVENDHPSLSKPLKPSELYDSKRSRKYSDFSNESLNYSSLPTSSSAPVRPPRRRNYEFPRKKSKAPQPPSQIQPGNKSDEDSVNHAPSSESPSKLESSPFCGTSDEPVCETATLDSSTEPHLLIPETNSPLSVSSSSGSDKNSVDGANTQVPVSNIFDENIQDPSSDHLSSTNDDLKNSILPQVADISFSHETKPLSDHCSQTFSLGPRPFLAAPLPVSNSVQNLTTTKPSSSPVESFGTASQSSLPATSQEEGSSESLKSNASNINVTSERKSTPPSVLLKAPVNLPPGPPPQKPPRTFAHDIYSSKSRPEAPVSSKAVFTPSSALPQSKIIEPLVSTSPLYSVVNKKSTTPKLHSMSNSCSKPAIAPKPSHIKNMFKNKRLSLAEPSLSNSIRGEDCGNSDLKTFSHLRYSFRKNPPDVPPPEPPNNPKPKANYSGRADAAEPASLCSHYSESFVGLREGRLNRQRSISDETLCSSSGYHRVAGDSAHEHIYATPDLQSAARKGGSGGELHYLCSDLVRGVRGSHNAAELSDRRANASPSNLISVWKHEFRQSCRLMHSKIKKSVNR